MLHRGKTRAHRLKSGHDLKKTLVPDRQCKFGASNMKWMDNLLRKKINLLIHLAHVDGIFAATEKALLKSILEENGLGEQYLLTHERSNIELDDLIKVNGKTELLYWCLKLIHADGELHPTELAYSRIVAIKLGFQLEVVDHFAGNLPSTFKEFKKQLSLFRQA